MKKLLVLCFITLPLAASEEGNNKPHAKPKHAKLLNNAFHEQWHAICSKHIRPAGQLLLQSSLDRQQKQSLQEHLLRLSEIFFSFGEEAGDERNVALMMLGTMHAVHYRDHLLQEGITPCQALLIDHAACYLYKCYSLLRNTFPSFTKIHFLTYERLSREIPIEQFSDIREQHDVRVTCACLLMSHKASCKEVERIIESYKNRYPESVQSLIDAALIYAVSFENIELIKFLLGKQQGANPSSFNAIGLVPLVLTNNETILKILREHGAKINYQNSKGMTALMIACIANQPCIAQQLIEQKANLNKKNAHKDTALMISLQEKHWECVKLLLRAGAYLEPATAAKYEKRINEDSDKELISLFESAKVRSQTLSQQRLSESNHSSDQASSMLLSSSSPNPSETQTPPPAIACAKHEQPMKPQPADDEDNDDSDEDDNGHTVANAGSPRVRFADALNSSAPKPSNGQPQKKRKKTLLQEVAEAAREEHAKRIRERTQLMQEKRRNADRAIQKHSSLIKKIELKARREDELRQTTALAETTFAELHKDGACSCDRWHEKGKLFKGNDALWWYMLHYRRQQKEKEAQRWI